MVPGHPKRDLGGEQWNLVRCAPKKRFRPRMGLAARRSPIKDIHPRKVFSTLCSGTQADMHPLNMRFRGVALEVPGLQGI